MTNEQLRIYNAARAKRGLKPLSSSSSIETAPTQFLSANSGVYPYTAGFLGEEGTAEFKTNLAKEFDAIEASTQFLFDAFDTASSAAADATNAINTALEAAGIATDANSSAADALSMAGDAITTSNDAQDAAIAAQGDATAAVESATEANTQAISALEDAQAAQADATQALADAEAANEAAIAAQQTATDAASDAAAAAQDAANAALYAADMAAKVFPLVENFHEINSTPYNLVHIPAANEAQLLVMDAKFKFEASERSQIMFYLNGEHIQFKRAGETDWRDDFDTGNEGAASFATGGLTFNIPAGKGGDLSIYDANGSRGGEISIHSQEEVYNSNGTIRYAYYPMVGILTVQNNEAYAYAQY